MFLLVETSPVFCLRVSLYPLFSSRSNAWSAELANSLWKEARVDKFLGPLGFWDRMVLNWDSEDVIQIFLAHAWPQSVLTWFMLLKPLSTTAVDKGQVRTISTSNRKLWHWLARLVKIDANTSELLPLKWRLTWLFTCMCLTFIMRL